MKNELGIFVQARMESTRLPGKIFKKIGERPALKILIDNLKETRFRDRIFILTTESDDDDVVEQFAKAEGVEWFRGSEEDVLDRFFQAAKRYHIQDIVRLTGDCPFLSMKLLENNIEEYYRKNRPDYYFVKNYPNGLGAIDIFPFEALERAYKDATDMYHREHVITYMEDNPDKFRVVIEEAQGTYNRPDIRLTLDERADLELLRTVYGKLQGRIDIESIMSLFQTEPELVNINKHVKHKAR